MMEIIPERGTLFMTFAGFGEQDPTVAEKKATVNGYARLLRRTGGPARRPQRSKTTFYDASARRKKEMKLYMPVKVYQEKRCVENHSRELAALGTKALIVTGKRSSRINGSQKKKKNALMR